MAEIEKRLSKVVKEHYKSQYEGIKTDVEEAINKIEVLRVSHGDGTRLVEQVLEIFINSWNNDKACKEFFNYYMEVATYANENAKKNPKGVIQDESEFTNPAVEQYFKENAGTRIKAIDETTLKYLRNSLTKSYENRASVSEWVSGIEKVVDCEYPKGRAEMIARTELAWAYNNGLLATYKENGTRKLQWLAVMDSHTCPICRGYHEEVFNIDDLPQIPAHSNCRCTLVSADE